MNTVSFWKKECPDWPLPFIPRADTNGDMSHQQDHLWQTLSAFEFDAADSPLTFTKRLARENSWSLEFARQVVEEYRRFLYLTQRAGHPVTPSDEVDQAWHLHLVYTRSYWDDLCQKVLGKPLHHGPTRGGQPEDDKYWLWYEKTRQSYHRLFETEPPADIWPDPEVRFSTQARWTRINRATVWLLPKQRVLHTAAACLALLLTGVTLIACQSGTDGGFDSAFIVIGAVAAMIAFISWLTNRHPQSTKKGRDTDTSSGCTTGCTSGHSSGCGGYSSPSHHSSSDHHSSHDSSHGSDSSDSGSSGCSSSGCGGGGCGGGGGD